MPILTNYKGKTYESNLVIVDKLTKIAYDEPVKVLINSLGLAKVTIYAIVQYHKLLDSIIFDRGPVFISRISSSFFYLLGINK